MIDEDGFRANVGIILLNDRGMAFWGRRIGMSAWQFPQGGIKRDETPEQAMYRELNEEVGLVPDDVEIIASTQNWLHYRLPRRFIRYHQRPLCIGQKQRWFVLRLTGCESNVDPAGRDEPEFDDWRWIEYWDSLRFVVDFKRDVYRQALSELAPAVSVSIGVTIPRGPI